MNFDEHSLSGKFHLHFNATLSENCELRVSELFLWQAIHAKNIFGSIFGKLSIDSTFSGFFIYLEIYRKSNALGLIIHGAMSWEAIHPGGNFLVMFLVPSTFSRKSVLFAFNLIDSLRSSRIFIGNDLLTLTRFWPVR